MRNPRSLFHHRPYASVETLHHPLVVFLCWPKYLLLTTTLSGFHMFIYFSCELFFPRVLKMLLYLNSYCCYTFLTLSLVGHDGGFVVAAGRIQLNLSTVMKSLLFYWLSTRVEVVRVARGSQSSQLWWLYFLSKMESVYRD